MAIHGTLSARTPVPWTRTTLGWFSLAASDFFYAWWDWRFVFLLAASTVISAVTPTR